MWMVKEGSWRVILKVYPERPGQGNVLELAKKSKLVVDV